MDATIQGLRLPEGFSGMLEDNGLPLPPLPLEAINELEQTDEWFFATDGREPLSGLAGLYLEAACSFIEACQACLPQSGVLNVVLDAERCAWRLDTPEGDVQQQGEGLYALLDLMQGLDSGLVGMSNVNWMRV